MVPAAAGSDKRPCSLGDPLANFEAPYPKHLIDSFGICQYRVVFDGETFTFCQDDFVLGGIVWSWEYLELGWSRQEAIADIELNVDRVWIDDVEMPLMHTNFKNGIHPLTGQMVVYQQRAFIRQLPVGDHTSYWENFHPDYGLATATVHLVVLATHRSCVWQAHVTRWTEAGRRCAFVPVRNAGAATESHSVLVLVVMSHLLSVQRGSHKPITTHQQTPA